MVAQERALLKSFHFRERIYQGRNKIKIKAYEVRLCRKTCHSVRLARQQARRPLQVWNWAKCMRQHHISKQLKYNFHGTHTKNSPEYSEIILDSKPSPKKQKYNIYAKKKTAVIRTFSLFVMYMKNSLKLRKTIQLMKRKHWHKYFRKSYVSHSISKCIGPTSVLSWRCSKWKGWQCSKWNWLTDQLKSSQTATLHLQQN